MIEQRGWACDSLSVYERAVEAFQIANGKLSIDFSDFCVPARDDCRGRVDHHLAFRIAAEANHRFVQCESPQLRID